MPDSRSRFEDPIRTEDAVPQVPDASPADPLPAAPWTVSLDNSGGEPVTRAPATGVALADDEAAVRSRRWSVRRLLTVLAGLGALLLTAQVLTNSSGELLTAADDLTRVKPAWLVAAIAVEVLSYTALGEAQRRLLAAGGARLRLLPMTAVGISAQAGANCLPGGLAVSALISFRRLNRRHVPAALCGWMLSVSTLLYAAVLGGLALVGAELAGTTVGPVPNLRPISLFLITIAGVGGGLLLLLRRRQLPSRALMWTAARGDHALARARRQPASLGRGHAWALQLRGVQPGARRLLIVTALLACCWLADGLCLALAFYALGGQPPWHGLLLSYCAAQLAATLPFTPGGLGVVEGSLTVALVAYGGAQQNALAAVLLYRLISFWGLIPLGGLTYLGLRTAERLTARRSQIPRVLEVQR